MPATTSVRAADSSGTGVMERMSPPAQKLPPAPVGTTARHRSSRDASRRAVRSAWRPVGSRALW
ncbi:hypothetical protein OHA64_01075 [Streptomyces sp. NBC_00076]